MKVEIGLVRDTSIFDGLNESVDEAWIILRPKNGMTAVLKADMFVGALDLGEVPLSHHGIADFICHRHNYGHRDAINPGKVDKVSDPVARRPLFQGLGLLEPLLDRNLCRVHLRYHGLRT